MAKKSKYSEWTRNYRQSDYIEDRRDSGYQTANAAFDSGYKKAGPTPKDREDDTRTRKTSSASTPSTYDPYTGGDDGATGHDPHSTFSGTPSSTTRKVDVEEAIQRTHRDRK